MYDRGKVLAGLGVFLFLALSPLWYGAVGGRLGVRPEVEIYRKGRCVEETSWMRAHHVDLLVRWRDEAVREGAKEWKGADGRVFKISLTGTCLDCHPNKERFCDRCHGYAGVEPNCWQCHVVPKPPPEKAGLEVKR